MTALVDPTASRPTSPPGGCKHVRRVQADVQAGRVPHPDGGDLGALVASIREALRGREDQLATVDAGLRALNFVCHVLTALRPKSDTDLDDVLHRPDEPQ